MSEAIKATVERQALLKTLGRVQRIVPRKNTIPILGNIRLSASNSQIEIFGTDLDVALRDQCEATVETSGETTVPAQMLLDIVRKMPEGSQIVIEKGDDLVMTVKTGRSRFKVHCLPSEDYPDLDAGEPEQQFSIPVSALRTMIDKIQFAISSEETRYYLNGIYFHVAKDDTGKEKLRGVATDGHRLSLYDLEMPDGLGHFSGIIIPRKTVGEVARLAGDAKCDVQISLNRGKIRFEFDGVVLISKLIDGSFPDYNRVIPQSNNRLASLDLTDLHGGVDRAATVLTERGRAVKLSFADKTLTISSSSPEGGASNEEVEVDYDADTFEIGFNPRYILDVCATIGGEKVTLKMSDPGSPTIFVGEDKGHLSVLMPMRV